MAEHAQGTLDGFALAREGAQRAMDHADQTVTCWSDQARGFMAEFIRAHASFPSEDVWIAAEKAGIPKPPDRRSWGGVINGFTRRRLIRAVGSGFSKLPHLHGNTPGESPWHYSRSVERVPRGSLHCLKLWAILHHPVCLC